MKIMECLNKISSRENSVGVEVNISTCFRNFNLPYCSIIFTGLDLWTG